MEWAASKTLGRVTEVTLLTPIRPGLVPGEGRTYEQRLAAAVDSVQRRLEQGTPTPISKMPTIHFARWLILRPKQYLQYCDQPPPDDAKCRSWLLFCASFDGDMKSYLREFSMFLAEDVDRIWRNCIGYPERGSADFEKYWDYAKRHQIVTHGFYSAYPELSVGRIRELQRFRRAFDDLIARSRGPDGRTRDDVARLLDEFLLKHSSYAADFPRDGGTYDDRI